MLAPYTDALLAGALVILLAEALLARRAPDRRAVWANLTSAAALIAAVGFALAEVHDAIWAAFAVALVGHLLERRLRRR